jgi:hypothetical protein
MVTYDMANTWEIYCWIPKHLGNFLLNLQDPASLGLSRPMVRSLTDLVETGTQIKAEIFHVLYFTDCTGRIPP